jgi:hypothetical protein
VIPIFPQAIEVQPDSISLHYQLGLAYQRAGRVTNTNTEFEKAQKPTADAGNAKTQKHQATAQMDEEVNSKLPLPRAYDRVIVEVPAAANK